MQPPQLTDEQRAAALARAGEARRVRAEVKELLKLGSLSFAELLERADLADLAAEVAFFAEALLFLPAEPPLFTALIVISVAVLLSLRVFSVRT